MCNRRAFDYNALDRPAAPTSGSFLGYFLPSFLGAASFLPSSFFGSAFCRPRQPLPLHLPQPRRAAAAAAAPAAAAASCLRLRLRNARAVHRDHRRIAMRQLRHRHAGRQRDVRQMQRVVEVHGRQVQLEELRQILRQAADFDVLHQVRDDAALGLHARRRRFALEVNRQMNLQLLVLEHPLQIHVHDGIARRMHLHVAHDRRLCLARRH